MIGWICEEEYWIGLVISGWYVGDITYDMWVISPGWYVGDITWMICGWYHLDDMWLISPIIYKIPSRYHAHIIQISPTYHPNITQISSRYHPYITHIIQILTYPCLLATRLSRTLISYTQFKLYKANCAILTDLRFLQHTMYYKGCPNFF